MAQGARALWSKIKNYKKRNKKMNTLPISKLKPDPSQPRQEFNPYDLELLKKSIASQGILQPLVVEKNGAGRYLIIDGERRFRAVSQLGLKTVPVEIVNTMSVLERLVKRFHLQEQHRNWSYFDKARAIKKMVDSGELKEKEIGDVLGLSDKVIQDMLALLNMSKRTQELAESKRVSYNFLVRTNKLLNKVKNDNLRPQVEEAIMKRIENGSIKRVEQIDDFTRSVKKAGDKIANKIVKDKKYTSAQAMKESHADDVKIAEQLRGGINWVRTHIIHGIKAKAYKHVDGILLNDMKAVRSKLDEFIKLAEK